MKLDINKLPPALKRIANQILEKDDGLYGFKKWSENIKPEQIGEGIESITGLAADFGDIDETQGKALSDYLKKTDPKELAYDPIDKPKNPIDKLEHAMGILVYKLCKEDKTTEARKKTFGELKIKYKELEILKEGPII